MPILGAPQWTLNVRRRNRLTLYRRLRRSPLTGTAYAQGERSLLYGTRIGYCMVLKLVSELPRHQIPPDTERRVLDD